MTGRRQFLLGLLLLWLAVYLWSVWMLFHAPPTGDGFTRGLNRLEEFGKWQWVAAMVAISVWMAGRRQKSGSALRRISRIPAILALLLVLLVAVLVVWARLTKPLPAPPPDPRPVTAPAD